MKRYLKEGTRTIGVSGPSLPSTRVNTDLDYIGYCIQIETGFLYHALKKRLFFRGYVVDKDIVNVIHEIDKLAERLRTYASAPLSKE